METALLEAAKKTVNRGLNWLETHQSDILQINDLSAHYKAPYLYAAVGNPVKGRYYANLMKNKYQQEDGDFRTSVKEKGWVHLPCSPANRYIYSNGWVICGLRRLTYYGAAEHGVNFIRRFQSPDFGGFASQYDPSTNTLNPQILDSSSTSSAGLALLACGDEDAACLAGDFILRLLSSQPHPDQYFYCSWDISNGLRTDVWGDEDSGSIGGRKQFCLSTDNDPRNELTWLVGKPMKFLAKLYDVTGENKYLTGARSLLTFFERLDKERIHNYGSCKIMWATAELYRLTGETHFSQTAEEILEWFCDTQLDSGLWVHSLWYEKLEDQPFAASLDIVQELCAEITDTIFELSL